MPHGERETVRKTAAVFFAVCTVLGSVTAAYADEEPASDIAVVSLFADLKAKASVDGEYKGFTPVEGLELGPGKHTFEFTYRDYVPQVYEVEIGPGANDIYFQLEPRLEVRKNKFNAVDLAILIGLVGGAVTGFVLWGRK